MRNGPPISRRLRDELRSALGLSLIPIGVAIAFGLLLLPRQATSEFVPVPMADGRNLERARTADHALAERARREPLPDIVRALGSALRTFHAREAAGASLRDLTEARRAIDSARIEAVTAGDDALLRLRAVELESFVTEAARFEATGTESDELRELAGGFVASMRSEGWVDGTHLAPGPDALRALFKHMWNGVLGIDSQAAFRLSLDEERALYAFYLERPHPSPRMRDAIAEARRGATNEVACQALVEAETVALEAWRIERINRLASIDPQYPAAYALGVANLHRGDAKAAAVAFQAWLSAHPTGPFALRAQNGLRAAARRIDGER